MSKIWAYGAGALQFYIRATDGTALFAEGNALMDANGIVFNLLDPGPGSFSYITYQINGAAVVSLLTRTDLAHDEYWMHGRDVNFQIYVDGHKLKMYADDGIELQSNTEPDVSATHYLGVPGNTFRYIIPKSTIGARPVAAAGNEGMLWYTSGPGATAGTCWMSSRNSGGTYEWVTLGTST